MRAVGWGAVFSGQALRQPEPLLGQGERCELILALFWERRLGAVVLAIEGTLVRLPSGVDAMRQILELGRLEERTQWQVDSQPRLKAGRQAQGEQRVPAEGEEIVLACNRRLGERFGPQRGQDCLRFGLRSCGALRAKLGRGQGTLVEFLSRAQGQDVECDEATRNTVNGQLAGQRGAQLAVIARAVGRGHDPGHESAFVQSDMGAGHGVDAFEGGFDLSGFDAIAVDLHLPVEAPGELELAAGRPAHAVSRSEQTCPWRTCVGIRHETFRRCARIVRVAARECGSADVELAPDADWNAPEQRVQDATQGSFDRGAGGNPCGRSSLGLQRRGAGDHGALGGAVPVDDTYAGQRTRCPLDVAGRHGLAAEGERAKPLESFRVMLQKGREKGGRNAQKGRSGRAQERAELCEGGRPAGQNGDGTAGE